MKTSKRFGKAQLQAIEVLKSVRGGAKIVIACPSNEAIESVQRRLKSFGATDAEMASIRFSVLRRRDENEQRFIFDDV